MFSLHEKVVYPGHGVAKINRIVVRKVAGELTTFFDLHFINQDMTILVPIDNMSSIGIRPLSSRKNIEDLFKIFQETATKKMHEDIANWSKRNKLYLGNIRTGDLRKICEIYRWLKCIEEKKDLSFGEKTLLAQTENLLAEEIEIVYDITRDEAINRLRNASQPVLIKQPELAKQL